MENDKKRRLLRRYQGHMERAEGGIFTKKGRKRLLGEARPYGGGKTESNFWNRIKNYVRNALVDLELFIETAGKERVDEVLTVESLSPIIQALLWAGVFNDKNRAEIAQLFIQEGFLYLESSLFVNLSEIHKRSISEAIDLSRILSMDIARGN